MIENLEMQYIATLYSYLMQYIAIFIIIWLASYIILDWCLHFYDMDFIWINHLWITKLVYSQYKYWYLTKYLRRWFIHDWNSLFLPSGISCTAHTPYNDISCLNVSFLCDVLALSKCIQIFHVRILPIEYIGLSLLCSKNIFPIMLALFLILLHSYYDKNTMLE